MIIENYLLKTFEEKPKDVYEITVPEGSILRACKAVPAGIVVWYEAPTLYVNSEVHTFKILGKGDPVPAKGTFVAIIDVIVETPENGQQVLIYPVYKLT